MEKKTQKWLMALGLSAAALSLVSASGSKSSTESGIEQKLSSYKHVRYYGSGLINGYPIGKYPKGSPYERPKKFIEVTDKNAYNLVSEHFRMYEFAQRKPTDFPKYLVIDPRVIAKLEFVIDELAERGYNDGGILLTSAFRSPWYNYEEVDGAKYSTHMYGLAIDFLVGDVDRDGDEDLHDAQIVYTIIDNIDRTDNSLLGGAGVYPPKEKEDLPFVHMDVRGSYKRWNKESTVRVPLQGDEQGTDGLPAGAEKLRAEWIDGDD